MSGTLAVGPSLVTPADPLSSESPLFSQAQIYFRNEVHIFVKMHRIEMQLCQKDIKLFSASIGHKYLVSKLNTWVHFEDYKKVSSMYRKLSLRTCDARWRSQPRPPSQEHKPVSAQLLWLVFGYKPDIYSDHIAYVYSSISVFYTKVYINHVFPFVLYGDFIIVLHIHSIILVWTHRF